MSFETKIEDGIIVFTFNNPKVKVGMTEIKLGMGLSPVMGNIMRFGLDADRNYRDIIMKGELVDLSLIHI